MITAITSPDATRAWTYGYDGLDRLILADNANGSADDRAYAYDDTDNLIYNSGLCAGSAASPNLVYPPIPPPPTPPPPSIVNLTDTYLGQMVVTMSSVDGSDVGTNALDNNTSTKARTRHDANEWNYGDAAPNLGARLLRASLLPTMTRAVAYGVTHRKALTP